MSRKITVDIIGDATRFTKATKDAQTTAQKFGNSIKTGLGIGAGIGAFNLLSTAISGTVDFLGAAVQAGMEEEASIAKMTAALKASVPSWDGRTAAIEKVIKAQMDLGFTDEEQRDSMARLVAVTKDVSKAQLIMRTAMDLARFKGISLAEATQALINIEGGRYKALGALIGSTKEITSSTQALAAVQKVATGAAEAQATTTSGKLLASQIKLGDKMDELGTVLLPVVNEGLDDMLKLLDALGGEKDLIDRLTDLGDVAKDLNPLMWAYNVSMADLKKKQEEAATAATTLVGNFGRVIVSARSVVDGFIGLDRGIRATTEITNLFAAAANKAATNLTKIQTAIDKVEAGLLRAKLFRMFAGKLAGLEGQVKIPKLHSGGVVPGPAGSETLALLQAGERVIPRGGGGGGIVVNVAGSIIGPSGVDELMDMMARRLRLDGV